MNRNVESHFSEIPSAQIQRSIFDRSNSYKTSFNAGRLIPFFVDEVLPGDTFDITTAKVVRSQTLLTPMMDNMYLDTYFFFVPNRLCWEHWQEFCGENTKSAWAPETTYNMPVIEPPEGGFASGTIADYMGLPVGVSWKATDDLAPMALPFRAYALICNDFFRDENLTDPLLIPTDDANQKGTNGDSYIADVANGGMPFKVAKYHDYFTSALPAPQKGQAVGIPINVPGFAGGTFPLTFGPDINPEVKEGYAAMIVSSKDNKTTQPKSFDGSKTAMTWGSPYFTSKAVANAFNNDWPSTNGTGNPALTIGNGRVVIPPQEGVSSEGTEVSFSVNELRLAFAYQRYLEALARGGSRYTEILLGLFGVRSPDARLQRPEYLGGNRIPISVSEVTNSAQSEQDFLGDLGAKSATSDVHHDFVKSFTEHGWVIGVCCVRYDHSYSQGLQRFWTRKEFTDYYNPKFAHLGEVPVYQAELYANGNFTKERIFGYQEIWADYRYKPNMVTGEMRPGVKNTLANWNLADKYDTAPTLSDGWIREDVSNIDRALAVTSSVSNQFWADIYVQNKCTRCMPMYSVPGLIDHF